jgi:hypothetical protein
MEKHIKDGSLLTAKEFLKKENLPTDILSGDDINYAMIEFAKLHVEAALKAAAYNAEISDYDEHMQFSPNIDDNSILNAYPLTDIK